MEDHVITPFITWVMEQTDPTVNGDNIVTVYGRERLNIVAPPWDWSLTHRSDHFGDLFFDSVVGSYLVHADENVDLPQIQTFIELTYGEHTP